MQPDLFDHNPLYQHHSATSKAAAESVVSSAAVCRRKVLEAFEQYPDGLTDEETQDICWLDGNSERPRRVELCSEKYGCLVVDSGRKRRTRSGREATVWILAKYRCDKQE